MAERREVVVNVARVVEGMTLTSFPGGQYEVQYKYVVCFLSRVQSIAAYSVCTHPNLQGCCLYVGCYVELTPYAYRTGQVSAVVVAVLAYDGASCTVFFFRT